MVLLWTLPDLTGSGKSKMAAAKLEKPYISDFTQDSIDIPDSLPIFSEYG